jgi:hypothetical protein
MAKVKDRPFGCFKCYGSGLDGDMMPCDCRAGDGWRDQEDTGETQSYFVDFAIFGEYFLRYLWYCGGCKLELRKTHKKRLQSVVYSTTFQNLQSLAKSKEYKKLVSSYESAVFRELGLEKKLREFLAGKIEPCHKNE